MIKQYDAAFLIKELEKFLKRLRGYEPHNLQRDNELAKKAWNDFQITEGIINEYHKLDEKDKKEYETFTKYSLNFQEIKDNSLPFIPEKIKKESSSIEELMIKHFGIDKPVLQQHITDKLKELRKGQSLEFCVLKIEEDDTCNIYGKQTPEEAIKCYDKKDTSKFPIRYIVKFKRDIQKGKEEFIPMIIDPNNLRKSLETKLEPEKEDLKKLPTEIKAQGETAEKKPISLELKSQDPYLDHISKSNITDPYGTVWKEAGHLQDPKGHKTAAEFLDDTRKHMIPGRKFFERKNGIWEEIPSATIKSYLEKKVEEEPKTQIKEKIAPKDDLTKINETELEKELSALQQSIKDKSKPEEKQSKP